MREVFVIILVYGIIFLWKLEEVAVISLTSRADKILLSAAVLFSLLTGIGGYCLILYLIGRQNELTESGCLLAAGIVPAFSCFKMLFFPTEDVDADP